jgi:protease YdgD
MIVFRSLAGLAFFIAACATGIGRPLADEIPSGSMTAAEATRLVGQLGLEIQPSDDPDALEVTWISDKPAVPGRIDLKLDGHGKIRSIDPVAPIPADRILYLSREALESFARDWNLQNPGPEYLELDKSGVFYLTADYPREPKPYDADRYKRQITDFRTALDRALEALARESKMKEAQGDKAYASDWELADPSRMPARAVGRLEIQGGYICTATLVADDIILTAAHCVMDEKGRHVKPLVFNAGIDHGEAIATAGILAVIADPDYDPVHQFNHKSIDDPVFGRDWALLKLDAPIGKETGTIEVFAATKAQLDWIVDSASSDVIQIGYGGQSGFRPKLRHDCGPADVLNARYYTTQCGLVKGDSGSPLLVHEDGKYRIIGINYAWVDLDYVNHVFLVVGSAAFDPTLKDLISGKRQAIAVKKWIERPDEPKPGAMGQPFAQRGP